MPTAISGLKNGDVVDPPASVGASPIQRPVSRPSAFGPLVERGYQQDFSRHPSAPGSGVSSPLPGFSSRDDLPAPSGEVSAAPVEDDTFGIIGGRGSTGRGGHRDPHHHHFHYRNTLSHAPTGYSRGSPHNTPSFPNRSVTGLSITNSVSRVAQQNAQEAVVSVLGGHISSTIDAVRRQVEYYFSVENLTKDTYLLTKMNPRMMVPLSQILSFPKIKQKNVSDEAVLAAVKLSKGLVVEVVKDGQDIGDEGRPVLSGGVPHSDECDGNWWIGPYPYSLPSSGCTLEFHGVPDTATVGDIEELTPEFSLLHSYNFANGAWNATYMDAASAFSALHCMLSLTPNKPIDQPISGSTLLCGKVVSVAIKGGERLVHEMMNSSPTRHTPNTSPKGVYQAAGRRNNNGGHQPITPVTIPPVPASSYNPNYPPGFMADMPTITVGKVPVQRIPMGMDSSIPPAAKSPCAPGARYTNSPYSTTAPVTTLMGASTTSSTSPGTSVAAKSTTQQSTLNWADLDDDDESADEDKPAVVEEIVAKPAKKGGLVPIGEEDDDDTSPTTTSSAGAGSSSLPTDASLTRAQKDHFHKVTAVAWDQQTRLAANMLRQRRALEAEEGDAHAGGANLHPNGKKSVPPKKGNIKQPQKDSAHSKAGFGGSTAISKDDGTIPAEAGAAADATSTSDPVVAPGAAAAERKESIAGYSLKGYNLTRNPFGGNVGGHHHRGGGAPTPFALSGNRSMMDMMEMMSMMYGASFPNAGGEDGANAKGWGRHGRPNAKASPFTGTQRVEEDAVTPTISADEPTAIIESSETPVTTAAPSAAPVVKAPTVLAALGADIDVAETNQRIAAATKTISKKPSMEQSTEGGHSDSTASVALSDDAPVPAAAAVVRSGWVAIAAAASTKPLTRADIITTKAEEPAKKGERRQKKEGKKSERKPRGTDEDTTAKAAPKAAAPAAAPVDEEPVKVHIPPTPTAASPVAATEPKVPTSSFLAAVMQRA